MDSDEETLLLALLLRRRRHRRRCQRRRSVWMHPITSDRLTLGEYYTLMDTLKADSTKFVDYFRMSQDTFNHLLTLLVPHIKKTNTNMRRSIPPQERLAITLRYLASGCSFKELHHAFRCGSSTARRIVADVCEAIGQHLHELCFPEIQTCDWVNIADGFESDANFPNCIGAIDGKHVRLIQPSASGSRIYKKYVSMVLLAVCDSKYRFTFFDIVSDGKTSVSTVCKNSELFRKLQKNTLNVPDARPVSISGDPLPFVFIGDKSFCLSNNILRPYGKKNLSPVKKIFNYRLSRARRFIECTFAILTNQWRIFHRPLDVNVRNAKTIIRACCTLHNFVRDRDGVQFEHTLNVIGLDEGEAARQPKGPPSAVTIRETFAEYFSSDEGSVPWQSRMIPD